jgi:FAD-linked sulfhydryl oxidase
MIQSTWSKLKDHFNTEERCDKPSCIDGVTDRSSKLVYPPDRSQIGRANWKYVHTRAANFPDAPTEEDKRRELTWIQSFVYTYPCRICARDFADICARLPPVVSSKAAYERWWIEAHNQVNRDLAKPIFKKT